MSSGGAYSNLSSCQAACSPAAASGDINASPNPCQIASGQTTCTSDITWSTANVSNVQVLLDLYAPDGSFVSTQLFAAQPSCSGASCSAGWIQQGYSYVFRLYGTDSSGATKLLDSVPVTGNPPPVPRYSCSGSSCVADPNGSFTTSNCNNSCAAPQYHNACVGTSCEQVSGSGSDQCSTDNDCSGGSGGGYDCMAPNFTCTSVSSGGMYSSLSSCERLCGAAGYDCNADGSCSYVSSNGVFVNQSSCNAACGTHLACNNGSCVSATGTVPINAPSDSDCPQPTGPTSGGNTHLSVAALVPPLPALERQGIQTSATHLGTNVLREAFPISPVRTMLASPFPAPLPINVLRTSIVAGLQPRRRAPSAPLRRLFLPEPRRRFSGPAQATPRPAH